jgi:isopentenyl-diphosphate delta-isomerase
MTDPNNDNPQLLESRKTEHIDICENRHVEGVEVTTLLEQVQLIHQSLPECSFDGVDTSTTMLGRTLDSPFMISGMTGGAQRAGTINRTLAALAARHGLAMGLGSQRAMMRDPELRQTYAVRDVAPDILLFGNIGAVQAASSSTAEMQELVDVSQVDALCVHINPAQELIQEHGDRDFTGCIDAVARLVDDLKVPVIAKETGCGFSVQALEMLRKAGVQTADISGAGGTTWTGVESLRARGIQADLGQLFWDWGIPTAVSITWARELEFQIIASGGIRSGFDAVRAIALGAHLCSAGLPFLRSIAEDAPEGAADNLVTKWKRGLRTAMVLTGSQSLAELRDAPRILGPDLSRWLNPIRPQTRKSAAMGFAR